MSEHQHDSPDPDFMKEAATRAERQFPADLAKLNQAFEPSLGELVNDGQYHPLHFLEQMGRADLWMATKGAFLPVYRSFLNYKHNGHGNAEGWPDPLDGQLFPPNLNPNIYEMVNEYIRFLREPSTEIKPSHKHRHIESTGAQKDGVSDAEMDFLREGINQAILKGRDPVQYLISVSTQLSDPQKQELSDYIAGAQYLANDIPYQPRQIQPPKPDDDDTGHVSHFPLN